MNPRQKMQKSKEVAETIEQMAEDLAELRQFNLRKCCPASRVSDACSVARELADLAEEEYLGAPQQLQPAQ